MNIISLKRKDYGIDFKYKNKSTLLKHYSHIMIMIDLRIDMLKI